MHFKNARMYQFQNVNFRNSIQYINFHVKNNLSCITYNSLSRKLTFLTMNLIWIITSNWWNVSKKTFFSTDLPISTTSFIVIITFSSWNVSKIDYLAEIWKFKLMTLIWIIAFNFWNVNKIGYLTGISKFYSWI